MKEIYRVASILGIAMLIVAVAFYCVSACKYNESWGKAIDDSLGLAESPGEVVGIGLADLRGVPFFLKGWVRGKFPEEQCNIIVFDSLGELRYQTAVTVVEFGELGAI